MSDKDYEHWPEETDADLLTEAPSATDGYDSYNGLRSHVYHPAAADVKPKPMSVPQYQMPVQYVAYPYGYMPQIAYTPTTYYAHAGYGQLYQPVAPAVVDVKPKKPEKPETTFGWQGRTRAEVNEDNMKIAASEGVYNKRRVAPLALKEDQMVWCVEVNGDTTLRTYATIKGFTGEWKADPRFQDSWYFVREQ